MIPRYSRSAMTAIWEPENKFNIWLKIEVYAAEAMVELGLIPKEAAEAAKARGGFDIDRIDEIEREVKHDVIAFLTSVAEQCRPRGALPPCRPHILGRARHVLQRAAHRSRRYPHRRSRRPASSAQDPRLRAQGHRHRRAQSRHPCRADHVRAEAGASLCGIRPQSGPHGARREEVATCAISGAVGTFAHVDPRVEAYVAGKLGLKPSRSPRK